MTTRNAKSPSCTPLSLHHCKKTGEERAYDGGEPAVSYRGTFRRNTDHFRGICGIYLKSIQEKPKYVNMQPVGLANTRISTNYAQNVP
jgi:hypothetical protein